MVKRSHVILLLFASIFLCSLTAVITGTGIIDINNLDNYANQPIPNYINKDNTPANNAITDEGATLGRVLFYDKNLSIDNSISCASCHKQEFAFGDTALASIGVDGTTGRHSMRLVNARFADETNFFWDERANSLEEQTTMPIQDHIEMGFSGTLGDPDIDSLRHKLSNLSYYQDLFTLVYGDPMITEQRMQQALAQFIRSIQSFDSKYDLGRANAPNDGAPFANFTTQENLGKQLFLAPPLGGGAGGAGCGGCHRAPEFDIDPNSLNNGVIGTIGNNGNDLTNTRAPSLRDIFNQNGVQNGPLMHNGAITTIMGVINHYNQPPAFALNANLDPRLLTPPGPGGQQLVNLNLTQAEKDALEAFIKTLSGTDIYTNAKWSDPFDSNGNLTIVGITTDVDELEPVVAEYQLYPNPTFDLLNIKGINQEHQLIVVDIRGVTYQNLTINEDMVLDMSHLPSGAYFIQLINETTGSKHTSKIIKQ